MCFCYYDKTQYSLLIHLLDSKRTIHAVDAFAVFYSSSKNIQKACEPSCTNFVLNLGYIRYIHKMYPLFWYKFCTYFQYVYLYLHTKMPVISIRSLSPISNIFHLSFERFFTLGSLLLNTPIALGVLNFNSLLSNLEASILLFSPGIQNLPHY